MQEFWAGMTLYMDQLHSMELFLLEELGNCEGGFEDLDLLSLGSMAKTSQPVLHIGRLSLSFGGAWEQNTVDAVSKMTQDLLAQQKECQPSGNAKVAIPSPATTKDKRPALEEWEINLYEVEFHKRSK